MTILGILLMVVLAVIGFPLYLAIIACGIFLMVVHLNIDPSFPAGRNVQ